MNKKTDSKKETSHLIALIGSNIRKRRLGLGMTQDKLAELADINEKYLSSVENGKEANLSIGYLVCIAVALDASILDLFRDESA